MDPAKERQGTRDGIGQPNVPLLKLDLLFTLWITSILQFIIFLFLFDHPETEGQTLAPFQVSIVQGTRNEFLRISTASSGSLYKLQCSKGATVINLLLCRQREREHHLDTWCVVENLQALPSGDTEKKNQCSPWLRKTGQWVRVGKGGCHQAWERGLSNKLTSASCVLTSTKHYATQAPLPYIHIQKKQQL